MNKRVHTFEYVHIRYSNNIYLHFFIIYNWLSPTIINNSVCVLNDNKDS